MNPVVQAHQNLKNVLLNGRTLINGLPLTAIEQSGLIQGEQMLFEKATQLAASKEAEKENPKKK